MLSSVLNGNILDLFEIILELFDIDSLENGWLKKKINLVDNPAKKASIETLRHGVTRRLTLLHGVRPNNSLSTRHNAALSERILEFSLVYAEQL